MWSRLGLCLALVAAEARAAPVKPHIIFILADDFGWHDVGFHNNSEVHSPTIDALARDGLMLGRHYAYKVCCPTRSSFISGRLPIHVNVDNQNGVTTLNGVDIRMATIAEKLKEGGYATHAAGKWHAGGHLLGQLPLQRGFDTFVGFLQGWENHFTQQQVFPPKTGPNGGQGPTPYDAAHPVDFWLDHAPAYGKNGTYGAYTFTAHAVDAIRSHNLSTPFFLYIAFQNTHTPLQVPEHYRPAFTPPSNNSDKSMIFGMVACMDESVRNITEALTERGMFANTLLVWSTDNGGHLGNSQNNFPLRGGKMTEFEGGLRQSAFVSGGFLPSEMRGKTTDALMHICDWYATFSRLAGVDPNDVPAGVPASDGLNMWPVIAGINGTSPRTSAVLTGSTLLVSAGEDLWKYIAHQDAGHDAAWVTPEYPDGNFTIGPACQPCLFNVRRDPEERLDLAKEQPELVARLAAELGNQTHFQTGDDHYVGEYTQCVSMANFTATHQGFLGPLCVKGPPLPPTPPAGTGCSVAQLGYKCHPGACASNGAVTGHNCRPSIGPNKNYAHGCMKGGWRCAVPASAKLCEQLPGCMGFALSLREWGIAKLYLGNATLVPNDDWEIWQR